MATENQISTQADTLDELLKISQDNAAEAATLIRRIQQHSAQLTSKTGHLRARGRQLAVAQTNIRKSREAVDEVLLHLRASSRVESLLRKPAGVVFDFQEFLAAVEQLDKAKVWLEAHPQLRVSGPAIQKVASTQEQALGRCEREFKEVLHAESRGLELGASWLDTLASSKETPAKLAQQLVPSPPAKAKLTSLAGLMLRGGRGQCLKAYTDHKRLLYGPLLQAVGPAEREVAPTSGTDAVEKRVQLWTRSLLGVLLLLIAERETCSALFGRQMGAKVFAEVGQQGLESVVRAGEALLASRRLPEKLFPVIEMYVQVSEQAPKVEVTLYGTPLEPYIAKLYALQRAIKAEAQALLQTLEEVIQTGGEGGKQGGAEVDAGTVVPVCAYMARFLKRIFKLTPEQLQVLVADRPQEDRATSAVEVQQALAQVSMRTLVVALQFLEARAEAMATRALGHVFLMNNIHFLVKQAEGLKELGAALGSRWVSSHKGLVQAHMDDYLAHTWQSMAHALDPPGGMDPAQLPAKTVKERFKTFNAMFEGASAAARRWVVPDASLKARLRDSIAELVVPTYREWLGHPAVATLAFGKNASKYLKFSPEDLEAVIYQQLFEGKGLAGQGG